MKLKTQEHSTISLKLYWLEQFNKTTITPYEVYILFNSLRLHFSSQQYNVSKYSGPNKNTTLLNYEKDQDKKFYITISKQKFPLHLIIANLINNPKIWVGELLTVESDKIKTEWQKLYEGFSYYFNEQLKLLDEDFNSNIINGSQHPKLFKLLLTNKISPETFLVINDITECIVTMNKTLKNDIVWKQKLNPLLKYRILLKINSLDVKNIFDQRFKLH